MFNLKHKIIYRMSTKTIVGRITLYTQLISKDLHYEFCCSIVKVVRLSKGLEQPTA